MPESRERREERRQQIQSLRERLNAIREQRGTLVGQARAILDADGDFDDAAQQRANGHLDEATALDPQIDTYERQLRMEQEQLEAAERAAELQPTRAGQQDRDPENRDLDPPDGDEEPGQQTRTTNGDSPEYRAARLAYYCGAPRSPAQSALLRSVQGVDFRAMSSQGLDERSMSAINEAGGGIFLPRHALGPLIEARKQFGGLRRAVIASGGQILETTDIAPIPYGTADNTGRKGRRLGEKRRAKKETLSFRELTLRAHPYTSEVFTVPWALMQSSVLDIENYIQTLGGEIVERGFNEEATVYKGSNGPSGVVYAAPLGASAETANKVSYDDTINLIHSVPAPYRETALYMCHDTTIREMRKLKDGEGRPIWQPSMREGEPDTINGFRYEVNNDMPEIGAKKRSVLFGDFRSVAIRDVVPPRLVRLDERYAESNEVGFILFSYHDALLIDPGTGPIKALAHP